MNKGYSLHKITLFILNVRVYSQKERLFWRKFRVFSRLCRVKSRKFRVYLYKFRVYSQKVRVNSQKLRLNSRKFFFSRNNYLLFYLRKWAQWASLKYSPKTKAIYINGVFMIVKLQCIICILILYTLKPKSFNCLLDSVNYKL